MQKNVLLSLALLVFAGCGGGNLKTQDTVLDGIEKNKNLSADQKEFARGWYRGRQLLAEDIPARQLAQMDFAIDPEVYKTWGLGPKDSYTASERVYLLGLDQLPWAWQQYSTVDLNHLTDAERSYLSQMHVKYGPAPINLRQKMTAGDGPLDVNESRTLKCVELLIGSEEFSDKDIVFYYRFIAGPQG